MAPTSRGPSAISTLVVRLCYLVFSVFFPSPPPPRFSFSLIFSTSPVASFLPLILSCHSIPLDCFSPSFSAGSSRGGCLVCSYTTCGMIVCDAERSGIPHQRFVFVIADATCRRRDASGYRDTRWIIYYDSPFNSGTHVRCTLRLLLLFFFIFSYEGEAAHGESAVLGDACGMQPLLSAVSLALSRHGAYVSSGKWTGKAP